MVRIDVADAAVAIDVVAGEEKISHPERKLGRRMTGRVPDVERQLADFENIPLVDGLIKLNGR